MMQMVVQHLQTLNVLKTVGTVSVQAELLEVPLQSHQLPAAIILPETETAQVNQFIGGHLQKISVRMDILLLELASNAARFSAQQSGSITLLEAVVKKLLGWEYAGKVLEYQGVGHVEVLTGLANGQLMRKISFGYTKYRKAAQ